MRTHPKNKEDKSKEAAAKANDLLNLFALIHDNKKEEQCN